MSEILDVNITRLYERIRTVLLEACNRAYRAVHASMVGAHWEIGRLIVEEEQAGKERADYGTQIIKLVSNRLIGDFGESYDERNLYYFRRFYVVFPNLNALRSELSWTHYRSLLRVKTDEARHWYMHEEYSFLKESEQLFAARYLLYLPSEAEHAALIREEATHFRLMQGLKKDK